MKKFLIFYKDRADVLFYMQKDEVVLSNSFQKMMPLGVQLKLVRSKAPRGDAQTEDGRLYGENCKI